jgi:hypothetical protein
MISAESRSRSYLALALLLTASAASANLLVATVITDAELRFATSNGNPALLKKLLSSLVKQKSVLQRATVVPSPH